MSERVWGKFNAGEFRNGLNALPLEEEPAIVIFDVPDVVRLPTELGGTEARVESSFTGPCVCKQKHRVQHLILEGNVSVACCTPQFLWYRTPSE